MWLYPIVFSFVTVSLISSCQTPQAEPKFTNDGQMVRGTISYPFYLPTDPIGNNGKQDKFVIKSITGNTEYIVEIPQAASEYEVSIPLVSRQESQKQEDLRGVRNPQLTDKELISQFPKPKAGTEEQRMLLDKAFGVAEEGGPRQAPSYTVGLAKLGRLYKLAKYEIALIEVNNLLAFYPNSSRLYKMKGTILIKLGNLRLAHKAWNRASELAPNDPVIRRGLSRLGLKIKSRQPLSNQKSQ